MSRKIKVRRNAPEQHINEIDLERLLEPTFVVRGDNSIIRLDGVEFPLYEDCRYCAGHGLCCKKWIGA